MAHRIEVSSKIPDTRAQVMQNRLRSSQITNLQVIDAYTIDGNLPEEDLEKIKEMLTNPVFQKGRVDSPIKDDDFDYAVEIGFLPGVTDNVANTVEEGIIDLTASGRETYSSQLLLLSGNLTRNDAQKIGDSLANPLIQKVRIKSREEFYSENGMGVLVPKVDLKERPEVTLVDLLDADEDKLTRIGKQGIENNDGTRRGPLALDLQYMATIQEHFKKLGRNPTDVELESIAQTWSEHCKHTIFADPIDEIQDGLYRHFIKRATNEIRKKKGEKDFCVSVFTDNAGAIAFDENFLITDKVETHNSPSALDPFGGSITGIVGVNRDAIGFGLGAKPFLNRFGYCFADPDDEKPLYKGKNKTQRMLSPKRIMEGVIEGVKVGGNCSGIPTTQGFAYFDERFKGKPLVFVGTLGLIPRESAGRSSHEKSARPGDYIIMVGGRVGKDGIHGATFSSEAIDSGSPATAVQIGDPITQKKLSDAIVKEARDRGLYNSITDNGAGGLSCSVAEMGKECGGCYVKLNEVPLKYPGLQPWEIWISESQERMTLAVPPEKWDEFSELMKSRGVEATRIGKFTGSGRCIVEHEGKNVMNLEMEFLHDGLPARPMTTTFTRIRNEEPDFSPLEDLTETFHSMLQRKNIASIEFISQQYDHEVQGGSVLKPLQGKGRVNGDATIVRPVISSNKGVVVSHGINPSYSDIDTYHMAASAIDTAIRNAVCAGARLDRIALLDNFCWCSSNEQERLGQLKRAVQACYDIATAYETPFISGKDSMFNDFKGFDENGNPVKISVPPTLLVSSVAVMDDVQKTVSLDAKIAGDYIYVLGEDHAELGGSEYFAMIGEQTRGEGFIGNNVPEVRVEKNRRLYEQFSSALDKGFVASAQSVHRGGLGVALAKTAMGGRLGVEVSLEGLSNSEREDHLLYSESQGRIVVTINPEYAAQFEETMAGNKVTRIGTVREDGRFVINGRDRAVVNTNIDDLLHSYKSTMEGY